MAAESIGNLIPTYIPGYSDAADIQAALRLYHYGSYSYNPANTSPGSLVDPSMAKTIYDIQQDILTLENEKSLNDLTDVTITSASTDQVLTYNGSIWVNAAVPAIDLSANYTWTGIQTFTNAITSTSSVTLRQGFNNFLNPSARDSAITSPTHGTMCFVRQDAGGNTINQIQYYNGSTWVANDGDISAVTAGTGLTGGGSAGAITISLDTSSIYVVPSQTGNSGKYLTTNGTAASWSEIDPMPQVLLMMGA